MATSPPQTVAEVIFCNKESRHQSRDSNPRPLDWESDAMRAVLDIKIQAYEYSCLSHPPT